MRSDFLSVLWECDSMSKCEVCECEIDPYHLCECEICCCGSPYGMECVDNPNFDITDYCIKLILEIRGE